MKDFRIQDNCSGQPAQDAHDVEIHFDDPPETEGRRVISRIARYGATCPEFNAGYWVQDERQCHAADALSADRDCHLRDCEGERLSRDELIMAAKLLNHCDLARDPETGEWWLVFGYDTKGGG